MLNNKQIQKLKYIAHSSDILKFNIGKDGLTKNALETLNNAINKHELIKVAFLKTSFDTKEDFDKLILEIQNKLNVEIIQKIGKTILIYRENPKSEYHINL